MPSGPVGTLGPSATTCITCLAGAITSATAAPRIQCGTRTGSVCTFLSPSARICSTAHLTARAAPSDPLGRGPTPSVSDSASLYARPSAMAAPINRSAIPLGCA